MCDDDYMALHDPGTVGLIGAFTVVGRSVGRSADSTGNGPGPVYCRGREEV